MIQSSYLSYLFYNEQQAITASFKPRVSFHGEIDLFLALTEQPQFLTLMIVDFKEAKAQLNKIIFDDCMKIVEKKTKLNLERIDERDVNCRVTFRGFRTVGMPCYQELFLTPGFASDLGMYKKSRLVRIDGAYVVNVAASENYLMSWKARCSRCKQFLIKTQTFLDVIMEKSFTKINNDHQCPAIQVEDDQTIRKYSLAIPEGEEDSRICQKITILFKLKNRVQNEKHLVEQIRKMEIYVDQNLANKLQHGDYVDLLCFYQCQLLSLQFKKQPKLREKMICQSFVHTSKRVQSKIFRKMLEFTKDSSSSTSYAAKNLQHQPTLYKNYVQIISALNHLKFPQFKEHSLSAFKLSVLCSLLTHRQLNYLPTPTKTPCRPLNLFFLSDQSSLLHNISKLPSLQYTPWPSVRDIKQPTLTDLLTTFHKELIIAIDPPRQDWELLERLLKGNIVHQNIQMKIEVTVWVFMTGRGGMVGRDQEGMRRMMEAFDIVMNVDFARNQEEVDKYRELQCQSISPYIDDKIGNQFDMEELVQYTSKLRICKEEKQKPIFYGVEGENIQSDQLLSKYYAKIKQSYEKIPFTNLESMTKVMQGIRLFRIYLTSLKQKQECSIDAFLTVLFLQEKLFACRPSRGRQDISRLSTCLLMSQIPRYPQPFGPKVFEKSSCQTEDTSNFSSCPSSMHKSLFSLDRCTHPQLFSQLLFQIRRMCHL